MASAVGLRADYSAAELRRLAAVTKNANQSRRLLSLAAVLDGMNRTEAAGIGGMDRQTLRDWVHRFNAHGPEGLLDSWSKGPEPRLSNEQRAEIADLVATGPDQAMHGVVRWRRIDLQRVIFERFGIGYHERTIGKLLKALGFSHISARPRHPAQDPLTIEAFKKLSGHAESPSGQRRDAQAHRDLVPGRGPHRPEERPRAAVGEARNAATTAGRPALRKRVPVRRHLPGPRHGGSPGPALCRHAGHATPPRRDRPHRQKGRPCRAAARSRRLAHDWRPQHPEEHHHDPAAVPRPGAEPGREHLAVPAPNLALQPRLRYLRRDHRCRLRCLAQANGHSDETNLRFLGRNMRLHPGTVWRLLFWGPVSVRQLNQYTQDK